jgi:pimeloyl-ACP methyl ester carboxylesterase
VKIIGFSDDAIDPVLVEVPKAQLNAIEEKIATNDKSKDWEREKQQQMLTLFQPNISTKELASIKTPILLIAGDRDLIANFHTVEIFESLPNAHLAILPNETHFTPVTNPDLFNSHVDKFFDEKFYRSNWLEAYSQLDQ